MQEILTDDTSGIHWAPIIVTGKGTLNIYKKAGLKALSTYIQLIHKLILLSGLKLLPPCQDIRTSFTAWFNFHVFGCHKTMYCYLLSDSKDRTRSVWSFIPNFNSFANTLTIMVWFELTASAVWMLFLLNRATILTDNTITSNFTLHFPCGFM